MVQEDDKPASRKPSPFLDTAQAAHYLGLSRKTLEKLRVIGGGPRFRRHTVHIRYHIKDLDTWSESHAHRTTHDPAPGIDGPPPPPSPPSAPVPSPTRKAGANGSTV